MKNGMEFNNKTKLNNIYTRSMKKTAEKIIKSNQMI